MARLTIELPAELGCSDGLAPADSVVESGAATDRPAVVDGATRTFVRWFDCWAGR